MTNEGTSPQGGTSHPTVSVIIPFLNPGRFLEEAIESVIAQTHSDWELLLVDDGTTDGSSGVARGYAARHPGRIFYLEHARHRNRGTPASRNLGIRHASGEYIAFLDSDDVWMPDKLASQTIQLEAHPEVVMTYGPCLLWYSWASDAAQNAPDTPQDTALRGTTIIDPPNLLQTEIHGTDMLLSPSGILVRRRAAVAVNGFAERFRGRIQIYEDHSFYAKLTIRESVLVTDQPCFKWRRHQDSCVSVALRAGNVDRLQIDFLRWLYNYLARSHPGETAIRASVAEELRLLRVRSLRASFSCVPRRIAPKFVRHWLRSSIASFRARSYPSHREPHQ